MIIVMFKFQSAAGLCIGVGSFSDPEELPGLAHFLEHSKLFFICKFKHKIVHGDQ